MKLAIVDIETTGLHGEEDFLLLARVKPLGEPAKILGLHNYKQRKILKHDKHIDGNLVLALRDCMESYDGWITYYGLRFDLPFIDDRLMLNGHDPLERRFARGLDLIYHASWFKSTFSRRSLEHVAIAFGYKGCRYPTNETIRVRSRDEAIGGLKKRENYDKVLEHNAGCCSMTEFVYEKLKPRIVTISKR